MSKNISTKRSAKKWFYLVIVIGLATTLFAISTINAQVKKANIGNQSVTSSLNSINAEPVKKLTIWNIIEMNDWLLWPFIILTMSGIMINVHRGLTEHRDKSRSLPLLQGKIRANGIRGFVQMVRSSRSNRAARLFYQIISTFDKTNQAQPVSDEVNQFLASEREIFERFNRVNNFLSESAGALGLLGTVWGIFETFYTAKMDGATILRGMSVALITTLTGLIISLVLNGCGTYLYTLFNRQLNSLNNKAEELRQVLLVLEKRNITNSPQEKEEIQKIHVADRELKSEKQAYRKMSHEIAFADI
ncbi:MAG TPA: MotA/TolQ/ExbB proton channel family protein [bacterium]